MPKYIKSHSNYRLSTKHQNVNSGKILERDITTIGGVSPYNVGKTAIYSSGNFIITVNNQTGPTRHVLKKNWVSNDISGTTWNANVLENQSSDTNGSVETNITLKNDFMDLRSFACYGSLSDLVENSIENILDSFPYELYTGNGGFDYSKYYLTTTISPSEFNYSGLTESSPSYEATAYIYDLTGSGNPANYIESTIPLYEIDNPAGVDIHTLYIDSASISDVLKYFANEGNGNYSIFDDRDAETPQEGYDFIWEANEPYIILTNDNVKNDCFEYPSADTKNFTVYCQEQVTIKNVYITAKDKTYNCFYQNSSATTFAAGTTIYFHRSGTDTHSSDEHYHIDLQYCPEVGDLASIISLSYSGRTNPIVIRAYRNENKEIVYLTSQDGLFIHIRPKESLSFYDNFLSSLNMFEKALMGEFSGIKHTAKFEIRENTDYGVETQVQTFVFPTTNGGYNIGGTGMDMAEYLRSLLDIAAKYDETYTDNMFRNMTHESLKNLDWTRGFNGNDKDDDNTEYLTTGEKFKSVIRIMGFFFDQEKAYIDCLGNLNTVTYDNRSNLSDYFLTDSLDTDGWSIKNITPYIINQYNSKGELVDPENWSVTNQRYNYYTREFIEDTNILISPYDVKENAQYFDCVSGETKLVVLEKDSNLDYYVDSAGTYHNLTHTYYTDKEYTTHDINNEFMKRLRINSRYLWRKKGTVNGVESILAILGFRGKKWFDALDAETQTKYTSDDSNLLPYDYEIHEYSTFTPPIKETWDAVHNMYRIDYLNSCKTVSYDNDNYLNGIYTSYQGLPIAYRDCDNLWCAVISGTPYETTDINDPNIAINSDGEKVKARRLYPYFDPQGAYDGDIYYQMKGGWLNFMPYSFGIDNTIITNDTLTNNKETLRSVSQTNSLRTLINIPQTYLSDGMVMYVSDLSENLAIVDGEIYTLYTEEIDDKTYYYFNIEVTGNAVLIGGKLYTDYLDTSNPNNSDGLNHYYLPSLQDGTTIQIYYDEQYVNKFFIRGYTGLKYYHTQWQNGLLYTLECSSTDDGAYAMYEDEQQPSVMTAFIDGKYDSENNNYTHYFLLNNINYSDLIGTDGWSQLTTTDSEYLKINPIQDNFEGNNPHCGGMVYDSGYEYMKAFDRLFGYAIDNELFDTTSFVNPEDAYTELEGYGFKSIGADSVRDYLESLQTDTKVHGFTDQIKIGSQNDNPTVMYTVKMHDSNGDTKFQAGYRKYKLSTPESLCDTGIYTSKATVSGGADSVTEQIMNTKVMEIKFILKTDNYYKDKAEKEIKYIQDKIMPYVEQMLPSTAIVMISFEIYPYSYLTDKSADNEQGHFGFWYNFSRNDGIWSSDN